MNFEVSFKKLMSLEFSSEKNALHWNENEKDVTFMGIYRFTNPKWDGWEVMDKLFNMYNFYKIRDDDLKKQVMQELSVFFYRNSELRESVKAFYKRNYWDTAKLDFVLPFDTANLIFIFGVNVGIKVAIKKAQEVVGVENDGIVGKITLNALNSFSPLKFVSEYKQKQIKYYENLVYVNPKNSIFLKGWLNRVKNS